MDPDFAGACHLTASGGSGRLLLLCRRRRRGDRMAFAWNQRRYCGYDWFVEKKKFVGLAVGLVLE